MKRMSRITVLASVILMSCLPSPALSQGAEQKTDVSRITAAGSGVNLGITRLLAEAFMKSRQNIQIEVPGSIGTKGAIQATADGAIPLGLISRPLKEEEKALGLVAEPYARVGIVVGAHLDVPDEAITSDELVAVYRGAKTRWRNGDEIIVQIREEFDSGFLVLESKIPGLKEACAESRQAQRWSVYYTDQDANRALSKTPNAIGISDAGMIAAERLSIKVLKLDGVAPNLENLSNGKYPLTRELSFIRRKGEMSKEVKAFLEFVHSDAGARILEAHQYLPLN